MRVDNNTSITGPHHSTNLTVVFLGDGEIGGEKKITQEVINTITPRYNTQYIAIHPSWSIGSNTAKNIWIIVKLLSLTPSFIFSPHPTILYSTHSFAVTLSIFWGKCNPHITTVFHYHGTKAFPVHVRYKNPLKILFYSLTLHTLKKLHEVAEYCAKKHATYVIAPSTAAQREINSIRKTTRTLVLPSFVDTKQFVYHQKVFHQKISIAWTSRLTIEKGIYEFIDGCIASLPKIDSILMAYISDLNEDLLQKIIQKNASRLSIQFHRDPSQANIVTLLQKADCAILPSFSEHFPLAMLEALACGTPYFSPDVGDCAKILTPISPHLILKTNETQSITDALTWFTHLSQPQRQRLSQKCRTTALRFTKEKFQQTVLQYFQHITHTNKRVNTTKEQQHI